MAKDAEKSVATFLGVFLYRLNELRNYLLLKYGYMDAVDAVVLPTIQITFIKELLNSYAVY